MVDTEQISKSRSHVGRCWFLSQERADNVRRERVKQESVRSFTTRLHQSEAARSVDGNMSSEVTVFSGSGWAGDKETRKSSSAGVALVGRHFFESLYKKTEKSSPEAEAELYAAASGASEAKGVESMMSYLGVL